MSLPLIYVIYTLALGILAFAVVPRSEIRRLSFWGIIYGAIADFTIIILVTHVLKGGGYKNYYPFGFMGIPFFPLLAWVFYFILYLYFLPQKRPWNIIYTIAAAGYSVIFSNILQNLGIFQWNVGRLFLPFMLYLSWNALVTWSYLKYFKKISLYEYNHQGCKRNKHLKLMRNTNNQK